jgi:hypothetical protein
VYRVNRVKRFVRPIHATICGSKTILAPKLERNDMADPRLGALFGLAWPLNSATSVASLILSGRSGASPYQISAHSPFRNYYLREETSLLSS